MYVVPKSSSAGIPPESGFFQLAVIFLQQLVLGLLRDENPVSSRRMTREVLG